jgi:spore coat polysaccharide biosynthesis protein SpsF
MAVRGPDEKNVRAMKTWGFIQMRMNSSRLPRKPFALISGKTLIERVYGQVQRCHPLDGIAFLSTVDPKDDELQAFFEEKKIPFYRGSVDDIADRFLRAAEHFKADRIVRIWGDCPFVHHEVIEKMLAEHSQHHADMTTNSFPATFPFGLNAEIYNRATFEKIHKSSNDPFFREFPIEYVKKSGMKLLNVENPEDLSSFGLTIDYEADRQLAERIFEELEKKYPNWSLANLFEVCRAHSDWFETNKQLGRNIDYKEKMNRHNPSSAAGGKP